METINAIEENKTPKKYTNDISELPNLPNEQINKITRVETIEQTSAEPSGEKAQGENLNEPVKKKRGRPLKNTQIESSEINNDYSKYSETSLKKDIHNQNPKQNNPTNVPNATPIQAQPPAVTIDVSKFITGALLLIVMDAVIPTLLIKGLGMFDPKYKKIDKKMLKLESDEKKALEPLANEVIKNIFMNINPITAFFVCTTIIYGSKIITLDDEQFN